MPKFNSANNVTQDISNLSEDQMVQALGMAPSQAPVGYDRALVQSLQNRAAQLGYKNNVPQVPVQVQPSVWQGVPANPSQEPVLPGAAAFEKSFRTKNSY